VGATAPAGADPLPKEAELGEAKVPAPEASNGTTDEPQAEAPGVALAEPEAQAGSGATEDKVSDATPGTGVVTPVAEVGAAPLPAADGGASEAPSGAEGARLGTGAIREFCRSQVLSWPQCHQLAGGHVQNMQWCEPYIIAASWQSCAMIQVSVECG
jgi:hypothetical protein